MEDVFKQKIFNPNSEAPLDFGQLLLPSAQWALEMVPSQDSYNNNENVTEKKMVLESFEQYATAAIATLPEAKIELPGGGILAAKAKPSQSVKPIENLERNLKEVGLIQAHIDYYEKYLKSSPRLIFVNDKFQDLENWDDLGPGGLHLFLPETSAAFFERMIKAMKLDFDSVMMTAVEWKGQSLVETNLSLLATYKCEVVVPLGAKASNAVLEMSQRLSEIHGKFYPRQWADKTVQVVPLFHPEIIETNISMKRSAWVDMQKIMDFLQK